MKCCSTVTRNIEQADGSKAATTCISTPQFASTDMAALHNVVKQHVADAYANEATLMTAINNASSVTALRAVNISSGWASIAPPDPGE